MTKIPKRDRMLGLKDGRPAEDGYVPAAVDTAHGG
jgi:hypothetical protein